MRKKTALIFTFITAFSATCFSQSDSSGQDTIRLSDFSVRSYFDDPLLKNATNSIAVADSTFLERQQNTSLLPSANAIAGVRMEERSPGSYRFSIRGSLLRSPFGIRNVKFYLEEFALTDAGGNTYLNLIDMNFIRRMEILKGPDGSIYGANSGGVVRLRLLDTSSYALSMRISGGSFGYFAWQSAVNFKLGKHSLKVGTATQNSDSYRKQSFFSRTYLQLSDVWKYSNKGEAKILLFYSDLDYGTPGGLTALQFEKDPRSARPATLTTPGAEEQNSSVSNRSYFGGIMNEYKFSERARHVIALFGMHSDFVNPFITNYEERNENSGGIRTYFEHSSRLTKPVRFKTTVGIESLSSGSDISNFGNRGGKRDTLQSWDLIRVNQNSAFTSILMSVRSHFVLEGALSYNFQHYSFETLYPSPEAPDSYRPVPVFMPKVAFSWQLFKSLAWRSTVSRGYSLPTTAEIRSSTQKINRELRPEYGWNYEIGLRIADRKGRFWWDISAFYFLLNDAIVRQTDSAGFEYFVNAGSTEQPGIESQLMLKLFESSQGFLRLLELRNSSTIYRFTFRDYLVFNGNKLTGVPAEAIVSSVFAAFPAGFSVFIQHNYTSEIPLNDANSDFASAYHLVQLKVNKEWKGRTLFHASAPTTLSVGVDNVLNEKYSLGNDLNAFGGRYYNAAPPRNYYVSIRFML